MDYQIRQGVWLPDPERCDVCVVDGKVSKSLEKLKGRKYQTLDLDGRMVLKGFADVHMHLDKVLVNSGEDMAGSLEDAIRKTHRYKQQADREEIYSRARRMAEACYRQGTRWIRTHVDVDAFWGLEALEAISRLKQDMQSRMTIQIVAFPQEGLLEDPENRRLLEEALKQGADLVGGIPAVERDPRAHIEAVMGLAEAYDLDVDMHIDETDDPEILTIRDLACAVRAHGWQGRVTAGHLCSLGANVPSRRKELLKDISDAGIGLVTLPSTNLYLQGRSDDTCPRRGLLPVREALAQDIPVAAASDNMQDFFNPFGRGNVLDQAYLVANCCYMSTRDELWKAFQMITAWPAGMMGAAPWVREGDDADFIILDARSVQEALVWRRPLFGCFERGKYTCYLMNG